MTNDEQEKLDSVGAFTESFGQLNIESFNPGDTWYFFIGDRVFWIVYEELQPVNDPRRLGVTMFERTVRPDLPSIVVSRDFKFDDVIDRSKEFIKSEIAKLEQQIGGKAIGFSNIPDGLSINRFLEVVNRYTEKRSN